VPRQAENYAEVHQDVICTSDDGDAFQLPEPSTMSNLNQMTKDSAFTSRQLFLNDIPALMQLESYQWDSTQAVRPEIIQARLQAHPELCVGTFCAHTGAALTSLFMKPVARMQMQNVRSWKECVLPGGSGMPKSPSRSLFGISLTSISAQAVGALEAYIWPRMVEAGWEDIYLGSPMPGLRLALRQDPLLSASGYAHAKRRNLPRDAQLRYYHQKGLRDIVAVLPDYFPHADALDYGVLLRGSLRDITSCALGR
jgi:hypothetical protein